MSDPLNRLTAREREVASLVAQGLSSETIAGRLGLSGHTVRKHRTNLMARLGLNHRAQLMALLRGSDSPNGRRRDR